MKTLVIIRGIPGAGKSTLAKALSKALPSPVHHLEADQFFTHSNGKYTYVPHLVPIAHEWCRRSVERCMQETVPTIIVSNTSTVRGRVEVYLELAQIHGYKVQQIVCFGEFGSVHRVPEEHMEKFRNQLKNSLIMELQHGELL